MNFPVLPYQVLAPAVSVAVMAVTAVVADHDVHPLRAAGHAVVSLLLVVALYRPAGLVARPHGQHRRVVSA